MFYGRRMNVEQERFNNAYCKYNVGIVMWACDCLVGDFESLSTLASIFEFESTPFGSKVMSVQGPSFLSHP